MCLKVVEWNPNLRSSEVHIGGKIELIGPKYHSNHQFVSNHKIFESCFSTKSTDYSLSGLENDFI